MEFRIADTFTDSLMRLTGDEQKQVKTTAFDLQINPAHPALSFHKLDRARDKNFWSVRVSRDIRLIIHRTNDSLLLCYVDHHDPAYAWAERRKLETHPTTGAAQLVEIRETVEEIVIPTYVPAPAPAPKPLFKGIDDAAFLSYGVPPEWLADVRMATEDTLLDLADHLPAEASEALLELATGGKPRVAQPVTPTTNPFDHPDAQRRFRIMGDVEELERALEYPWEKWTIFLHPEQRQWVEHNYNGPARVSGSAGTGKTVVALHRAVYLARTNPDARVLVTTFSETLANLLRNKLIRLVEGQPRLGERIEIYAIDALGKRLYKRNVGPIQLATDDLVHRLIDHAATKADDHKFSPQFLYTEWDQVIDAWQLTSWEAYRDVTRLGRKTRLPETQRTQLWSIFAQVQNELAARNLLTKAELFTNLAPVIAARSYPPFDFAIVDEAQDLSVAQLKFLAALGRDRSDALFFAGDLGQRIFQQPFSWKQLGVDVRGRSRTLRVNYRTSHQIRTQADRLLDPEVADVDGNRERRDETISVFNGPEPEIHRFADAAAEQAAVGAWLTAQNAKGIVPEEIGLFVRSAVELQRACAAVEAAGLPYQLLDDQMATRSGAVAVSTMHLAKGLEFRTVVVMACDDEVIPSQARIETVGDDADLQEVYATERHLLYVACTRARDHLLVTGVKPASEFLDDLQ
ncbi:MAG: UvrD-helicase domain-containing protein [Caldilineaceae bacterium]